MPRQSILVVCLHKLVQTTIELEPGALGEESTAPGEVQEVPLQYTLSEASWQSMELFPNLPSAGVAC